MKLKVEPRLVPFEKNWAQSLTALRKTMNFLDVSDWRVECALGLNGKNLNSNHANDPQRAVSLFYTDGDAEVQLTVDRYPVPAHNLRAIYLAMESRRMNMVRGIDDQVQATYLALAAPAQVRDPYEVLGVRPDQPIELVEAMYRAQAKLAHSDVGGSDERMKELNRAIEIVREAQG